MRDGPNRQYTRDWLQVDRPQPMYDNSINQLYSDVYHANPVHNQDLIISFKSAFLDFLDGHKLSQLRGYKNFPVLDICIGCTQFIDDIYQRVGPQNVMTFANDYKYHWRLNPDIDYITLDNLDHTKELIISMPFPAHGDVHPDMTEILERCNHLKIPVHIDGAWITCSRDINFDFDHPAIQSFAISLSKGGLGNDRIGIRFSRTRSNGAVSIMNDFNMNCQSLMHVGLAFMEKIGPEYFWRRYLDAYQKVCDDFDLIPTKAIHLAKTQEGQPVGIRPLLRCIT
jgi:hypothetical protein